MYSSMPKPAYPTVGASRMTLSSSHTRLFPSAARAVSSLSSSSVSVMVLPSDRVTVRLSAVCREFTSPPESSWSMDNM